MRVAFLRGINVGGNNRLPMNDLAALLEGLGARAVRTYLQSGNAVFDAPDLEAPALAEALSAAIERSHGFRPRVLILDAGALERAAAANPFPDAEAAPTTLHLFFLADPPHEPDLAPLHRVAKASEAFALGDGVFYLHTPDGIGRSKLADRVARALGVEATARNWRTVTRVLDLARGGAG